MGSALAAPVLRCGAVEPGTAPIHADDGNLEIVVPFPAGGSLDALARVAGPVIGRNAGGHAAVVNIGGASGAIAMRHLLQRPPDGRTLLLGTVAQLMLAGPAGQPLASDTVALGKLSSADYVIVCGRGFRPDSLDEFVAAARLAPGEVSMAHPGQSSIQFLTARMIENMAGIRLLMIPYSGSAPMLGDIVSGQVDVALIAVTAALPMVTAGRLKALGLLRRRPHPLLPTWPYSGQSSSLGQIETHGWVGLFAAAATSGERVQQLRGAISASLRDPDLRNAIVRLGQVPAQPDVPEDSARFTEFVRAEVLRYEALSRTMSAPVP